MLIATISLNSLTLHDLWGKPVHCGMYIHKKGLCLPLLWSIVRISPGGLPLRQASPEFWIVARAYRKVGQTNQATYIMTGCGMGNVRNFLLSSITSALVDFI